MSVKTKTVQPLYSIGEEIGNAVTHGIAVMVSIGGIAVLVLRAGGRALETAAVAVYGLSMLLAFSMSTLYHALTNQKAKGAAGFGPCLNLSADCRHLPPVHP